MNATLPVSQTPIASDPAQSSAAAAANSVNSGGKGQDFAAALTNAGPKPVRKAAGAKAADAGTVGGHLPAAGNLSPPPTPPPAPPLTTGSAAAAAAAAAATAAATAGTLGGAPIPGARVGTAAPAALTAAGSPAASILDAQAVAADQKSGTAPADSPVTAPGAQGATSPGAGFGLALGLPVDHAGEAGAPSGDRAAAPSSVTAVTVPGDAASAKGAARAAVAVTSTAQAGAANKAATVATTAAVDAAASRPTPASRAADGSAPPATPSSTSTGASTNTDATAQAVTAAAMSAAATGTVAPGDTGTEGAADLSALPTNESVTPATAAKSSGTPGPNGPPVPVPAPVISVARPVTEVSAKAPAAPAGTALAGAGAADKRASGGTGDSLLSGTSVDGSAAGAAQLGVNPTAVADATTAPPTLKVAAGVETREFGHGLADRVSWMVDNNLNGAKLQVNPPQLGPIEVRIAVQGGHAQVWLTSHSAVTRDALESSSSKLREMLGAQGFGQVSVDISQRSYQDRSAYSQPYESMPSASRSPSTAAVQSTTSSLARISSGAVDAYA
jgi:flagellar hook-length control protein FliK